ncbi:Uncharacterised protein [Yersinia massiliensis]|uniref:hypothetical protein n=1 Tax=Yersinia massiliensis TaxID=419257 RepID=UPI0005E1BD84|nr:hypothetical protein [Yersinia massiliensis]CNH49994.1 Uncharacterised protein [Yersinia massiliensis]
MSAIGARVESAIIKAFKHTEADHFTKKDMNKLSGLMKEIKNSSASIGPFDRLEQNKINDLKQKIETMIGKVDARESKLQSKKMDALTGLQAQLVKITSTNQPKVMADTSRLEKQKADKASTVDDSNIDKSLQNMPSHPAKYHRQEFQQ